MKIEKEKIVYIKSEFKKMQTRQELLALLNFANSLLYGDNYMPFQLKYITYYSFSNNSKKAYKEFKIRKKSGAERIIYAPEKILKAIQKSLALILQCVYEPNIAATGFVMGKSIVDNARVHIRQNHVYNIDLKDFFPSIDQARVWSCLKLFPFNLKDDFNESKLKNIPELSQPISSRLKLANIIANVVCTEMHVERKDDKENWIKVKKNVLPQGAPTSPILSNVVCQKLDHRLTGLAKRFNLNYTRYADDITFSSMHNIYQENSAFLKELTRIIKDQNFDIKTSKTRLQKTGYRQEVTGLIVNEKVNVRNRYVKQIRMWLYYWEKYGYNKAESIFLRDYQADKGHIKKAKPNFQNVLSGKLEYLKMVKGVENTTYVSLNKRFEKLCGNINTVDTVLDEWENNGIESAMKIYKFKDNE